VADSSFSALLVDELAATTIPGRTLVTLTSVSEDDLGEELTVIWEVEPGQAVIPAGALPDVPDPDRRDDLQQLSALVDAVRWGPDPARSAGARLILAVVAGRIDEAITETCSSATPPRPAPRSATRSFAQSTEESP
jgi:hypothetical protein